MAGAEGSEASLRLFVACMLDAAVLRRVMALQARVRRVVEAQRWRVAWTLEENVHVTLKFLGAVSPDAVPSIGAVLARVAQRHEPFDLEVCDVGTFPERGVPRVLFAELGRGVEALRAVAHDLERALEVLGFAPEGRAFHGHVTFGRVKHAPRGATLALPIGTGADTKASGDCGVTHVGEVVLVQSELSRAGPVYRPLQCHVLGSQDVSRP